MKYQKHTIDRAEFPLENHRQFTKDGRIVTSVHPGANHVVVNQQTGEAFPSPDYQGTGVHPLTHWMPHISQKDEQGEFPPIRAGGKINLGTMYFVAIIYEGTLHTGLPYQMDTAYSSIGSSVFNFVTGLPGTTRQIFCMLKGYQLLRLTSDKLPILEATGEFTAAQINHLDSYVERTYYWYEPMFWARVDGDEGGLVDAFDQEEKELIREQCDIVSESPYTATVIGIRDDNGKGKDWESGDEIVDYNDLMDNYYGDEYDTWLTNGDYYKKQVFFHVFPYPLYYDSEPSDSYSDNPGGRPFQYLDDFTSGPTFLNACKDLRNDPPSTPLNGDRYIVGDMPTGTWEGYQHNIAEFQSGAWVFVLPSKGDKIQLDDEIGVRPTGYRYYTESNRGNWEARCDYKVIAHDFVIQATAIGTNALMSASLQVEFESAEHKFWVRYKQFWDSVLSLDITHEVDYSWLNVIPSVTLQYDGEYGVMQYAQNTETLTKNYGVGAYENFPFSELKLGDGVADNYWYGGANLHLTSLESLRLFSGEFIDNKNVHQDEYS